VEEDNSSKEARVDQVNEERLGLESLRKRRSNISKLLPGELADKVWEGQVQGEEARGEQVARKI